MAYGIHGEKNGACVSDRTILITFFGSFPGVSDNPTGAVAHRVERIFDEHNAGVQLVLCQLPVSYTRSITALEGELSRVRPDALISLGVAPGRGMLSLERVAVNIAGAGIADVDGVQLVDAPVVPGGPDAYFSTLPVRAAYDALDGEPVEMSYTAGTYVCNTVFYAGRHLVERLGLGIPAGFVHIPATRPDDGAEAAAPAGMVAHTDAGGVQGVSLPTLPAGQVARMVARVITCTLDAV